MDMFDEPWDVPKTKGNPSQTIINISSADDVRVYIKFQTYNKV